MFQFGTAYCPSFLTSLNESEHLWYVRGSVHFSWYAGKREKVDFVVPNYTLL